jgi:geranylgeranyl diphosphate synthase type I
MQEELKAVSRLMDQLLAAEVFPRRIQPAYLREAVCAYPARGGKRLRAALVLWCCELCGADPRQARQAALAVELYHNWTLIHDDIIDDDAFRRGLPSCHLLLQEHKPDFVADSAEFGRNMAILAGDVLHGWAVDALNRVTADGVDPAVTGALVGRLAGWVTPELISGEALDVEFESRPALTDEAVENMLRLKTGVLLQFAAETGAMIGLCCADHLHPGVVALGRFAADAGLAFQLQDDILGIFGDEASLGKPVGSDLREGKQTLLYLEALKLSPADQRAELQALWGKPDADARDLELARRLLVDCGAREAIRQRAEKLVRCSQKILLDYPDSRPRLLLGQWADFMLQRAF